MARPPTKRKTRKEAQFQGKRAAQAETKYSTAIAISTVRRPNVSAGRPTAIEPTIVPISTLATVNPSQNRRTGRARALELKDVLQGIAPPVVPEITAVSKPKSSPPRAATMARVK